LVKTDRVGSKTYLPKDKQTDTDKQATHTLITILRSLFTTGGVIIGYYFFIKLVCRLGGSAAEWLACWTQVRRARVQIAVATLSGNSLRQTVHTHCATVHQAAKLVAALLRVAGVTASLAESNDSLPPGL